ncbi:hypothetical protein [Streptomyces acidiscabies]|uniref:hypothetical protein n=1 Tax=Streptomyces acidiscabies TaxID=42234 RepID=UPI0038F71963
MRAPGLRLLAVVLLATGTALTACSDGGGSGGGGATATAGGTGGSGTGAAGDATGAAVAGDRSVAAYTACMAGHGVRVVDGEARADGVADATLGRAARACRASAPDGVRVPVTRWEVALLTDFVTCMRGKGHTGYGDPDPRTGTYAMPEDSAIDKGDEIACLTSAEQKAGR